MGTNLLVKRAPPEPLAPCLKQKGDRQRKSVHFAVAEEGSFNSDIEDSLEVIHPEANRAVKIPNSYIPRTASEPIQYLTYRFDYEVTVPDYIQQVQSNEELLEDMPMRTKRMLGWSKPVKRCLWRIDLQAEKEARVALGLPLNFTTDPTQSKRDYGVYSIYDPALT